MKRIELDIVALSHSVTQSHNYAVVLGERKGQGRLPIVIGSFEAQAIAVAMERMVPNRPLTHDLLMTVIGVLGAKLENVVITEVRDHTYYAELHISTADGEQVVSSRPSDAIALAVRCEAPIFAVDQLIDEVGQLPEPEPEEQAEEIIDEFKDFIENVSPDDFAS